jgi:hypothetical protein
VSDPFTRWRALHALIGPILGALLVAACSGSVTVPGSSPAAGPARMVRSAAEVIVLQPADVPASYKLDTDDQMSAQALAQGLSTSTGVLKDRGASGYIRAYKEPSDPFVCCLIDSILITTASEDAARAIFADFRATALGLGSTETDLGESLGDESRGLVFQQPTPDGDLITVSLLFRYANVVDAVEVTGRPGSFERAYVLEFARKQLARLRADAEKT